LIRILFVFLYAQKEYVYDSENETYTNIVLVCILRTFFKTFTRN